MFNIGLSELILILLVAFLIVGPKDLPKVARALGRFTRFLKTKWQEFLQETELDETVAEFEAAKRDIKRTVKDFNPLHEVKEAQDMARTAFTGDGSAEPPPPEEKKEDHSK
ncbi:MAG: twin-arginine translocase subunit TatB [Clostridiales bacterium]|nr:twin-arginine translocase subunit TatB [Clostridiales bacterium]